MAILKQTLQLANGNNIPLIGLGTWQMSPEEAKRTVEYALKNGYTHIDTARSYGNEEGVGRGMKASEINRENYFLTTKVTGGAKSYKAAKQDIETSLKALDTPYIDLVIIHAPRPWNEMRVDKIKHDYYKENQEVWKAMEEFYEQGKVKAIGVSNFEIEDLNNLFEKAKVRPMLNQIKYHIGHRDEELVQFCQENDMVVEAYSPIGTGKLLNNKNIQEIADKYGKTTAQISIRYAYQKGLVVLPKSVHEEYIDQNAAIDFEISIPDMDSLNRLVID